MSTKALLKTAREKLNKKDFGGAKDAAERVLDFEPSNYTAYAPHTHFSTFSTQTLFYPIAFIHTTMKSIENEPQACLPSAISI